MRLKLLFGTEWLIDIRRAVTNCDSLSDRLPNLFFFFVLRLSRRFFNPLFRYGWQRIVKEVQAYFRPGPNCGVERARLDLCLHHFGPWCTLGETLLRSICLVGVNFTVLVSGTIFLDSSQVVNCLFIQLHNFSTRWLYALFCLLPLYYIFLLHLFLIFFLFLYGNDFRTWILWLT